MKYYLLKLEMKNCVDSIPVSSSETDSLLTHQRPCKKKFVPKRNLELKPSNFRAELKKNLTQFKTRPSSLCEKTIAEDFLKLYLLVLV